MEKSSGRRHRRCCKRLLIISFALCTFFMPNAIMLNANALSWEDVQSLQFQKREKYFFTVTECPFVVDIETVSPEKVSVFVNDVPQGVSFMSSKKETFIPNVSAKTPLRTDGTGTRLILYFRFEKPGEYRIKPVDVRIDGLYCRVPVEPVYVYENPNLIRPELSVHFTHPTEGAALNGSKQILRGDSFRFTLYVRYALQVPHFSWDIPEDSIFIEQNRYEITERNPKGSEFSPELVPIATFEWKPLKTGSYKLPTFFITATSYSGIKYNLSLPDFVCTVLEADVSPESAEKVSENLFEAAFFETDSEETQIVHKNVSQTDLEALLRLHQKEKHSFPLVNKKIIQERIALEETLGIPISLKEASVPFFIFCGIVTVLFFVAALLLFRFSRKPLAIFSLICGCFTASLFLYTGCGTAKKKALFTGSVLRAIPEYDVKTNTEIPKGCTLLLEKQAGDWYFVHFNENSGWVQRSDIMVIK